MEVDISLYNVIDKPYSKLKKKLEKYQKNVDYVLCRMKGGKYYIDNESETRLKVLIRKTDYDNYIELISAIEEEKNVTDITKEFIDKHEKRIERYLQSIEFVEDQANILFAINKFMCKDNDVEERFRLLCKVDNLIFTYIQTT